MDELKAMMKAMQEHQNMVIQSQNKMITDMQSQIGHLTEAVRQRDPGKLPSSSEENPKGKGVVFREHAQAVTVLRSGKKIDKPDNTPTVTSQNSPSTPDPTSISAEEEPHHSPSHKITHNEDVVLPPPLSRHDDPSTQKPRVPYPERLSAPGESSVGSSGAKDRTEEIMDTFRKVQINLPLQEAIKQIPSYAKFLKDLCTQKRRSRKQVQTKVILPDHVSSVLQHGTPPKMKDPGAPYISVVIGNQHIDEALLDLGAG